MAKQRDFTEGNIWRHLVLFSGPIILTNLLQTSYQFIDSLWIGNLLGVSALGSVAIASAIVFTVLSFVIGINNSALTILSQQKGKKNEQRLKRYLNAFVVVLTSLSLLLSVIGYLFSEELLVLLGTPDNIMSGANAYLRINFIGIWFLFGYNFISTVLRSLGDSKTPLRFVAVAVFANAALDPLFISVFGWGIQGAAYATIISQGGAFLYGLVYVLYKQLAPFCIPHMPSKKEVFLILQLGIPAGLQMSVISAGSAAIMSVVTVFGESVVAGYGAVLRLNSLVMLPATSLGTAVNSMAGQNIGVGKWDRVKAISRSGILYNLAVMMVLGIGAMIFARFGMQLFIKDEAAVSFGATYLRIVALCFPFLGINFVLNGIVRASGAMFQVLILNIISFWILRYPFTFLFSHYFGENGIAIGMGLSFIVSSGCAYGYYRYGKWRKKDLFHKGSMKSD